jgi:hypothetical protein
MDAVQVEPLSIHTAELRGRDWLLLSSVGIECRRTLQKDEVGLCMEGGVLLKTGR